MASPAADRSDPPQTCCQTPYGRWFWTDIIFDVTAAIVMPTLSAPMERRLYTANNNYSHISGSKTNYHDVPYLLAVGLSWRAIVM